MSRFSGFRPACFSYLKGLAENQTKAWYQANLEAYEAELRGPLTALVVDLAAELERRGVPLTGDPKQSLFRQHRDVRFSKDKSPYKTHGGAVLFRQGGGKTGNGVLYIHIEPARCFTAAAFYHPDPEVLGAIREGVRVGPENFLAMTKALADRGLELDRSEALTRMPRGFEDLADTPVADAIKLKNFLVQRDLSRREVGGAALVPLLADFAGAALPLLRFGWQTWDEVRGEAVTPAAAAKRIRAKA